MDRVLIDAEGVIALHDKVLNPGEIRGLAGDRSLSGALGRVENRIAYGLIGDVHDLAAAYAVALARGHVFNDGNKRTAFVVLVAFLERNGHEFTATNAEVVSIMLALAGGDLSEAELASWIERRTRAS